MMIETSRFDEILSRFSQARVAVLGDFFLDLYIQMDRSLSEFSLETHKEAFQAVKLRSQPGAAGVVANNLVALGAHTTAIGYTGNDGNGFNLRQALEERHINIGNLIETETCFTQTYIKPIMQEVDGTIIELNRIDIINRSPNPHALYMALLEIINQIISTYDGILVVEQVHRDGYGTLSPLLRKELTSISCENPEKTIMIDSRHFSSEYQGLSLKLNLSEAVNAASKLDINHTKIDMTDKVSASELCANAFWDVHQKPAFITLGETGISGMADGNFFHYPGYHVESPIDIVGAGDSVLAGIGLACCAGATAEEAAYIGNLVGSITVQQLGTTGIATQADLRQRHLDYQNQIKA
jgi:rfaE bifunctional protein kinase chain/domain